MMTRLAVLAALGSFGLLAGAFVFQSLGYAPCKLCLWQRWPHGVAVAIGLLVLWRPLPALMLAGAAAALTTAAIGAYHTGVERGWVEGPSTCTSGSVGGLTPEELMAQILSAPLVRCDEVAWAFLGVSMANWNMLFSMGLAGLWLWGFAARDRRV